jgi:hypothetical protein
MLVLTLALKLALELLLVLLVLLLRRHRRHCVNKIAHAHETALRLELGRHQVAVGRQAPERPHHHEQQLAESDHYDCRPTTEPATKSVLTLIAG